MGIEFSKSETISNAPSREGRPDEYEAPSQMYVEFVRDGTGYRHLTIRQKASRPAPQPTSPAPPIIVLASGEVQLTNECVSELYEFLQRVFDPKDSA